MKRKLLTLTLASAMTLGSIVPSYANTLETNVDTSEKSNIETLIGFKYPETVESLKSKNLKATLIGKDNQTIEIELNKLIENQTIDNVTAEVENKDGKITSIKFKIDGLTPYNAYNLTIDGDKYVKTDIKDLDTTKFSKRIDISTNTSLKLGDVDNNEIINEDDIKLLEQNLNTSNTDYDINGDGKVTVSDIVVVNKNMDNVEQPKVYDTTAIPSAIVNNINKEEISSGSKVEGDGQITDIFKPEGEVKLVPASEGANVNLPISFNEPTEITEFSITLPDATPAENVTIKFFDEKEQEIEVPAQPKTFAVTTREAGTVVTINLGKRVPVKKISVDVKPKEDGFVVVKEVTFLKDVVDDSILEDTKVKNVKASALDEEVALSWRAVSNVTGYKIAYGTDRNNLTETVTTSSTKTVVTGLENLKEYYFQISATSEGWEGEKSEIISATPVPKKAPKKPDFLRAEPKDSEIELSWNKAEGAEWYNVYTQTESDKEPVLAVSNLKETKTKITGLQNGTTYKLYVKAFNSAGESPFSDFVEAIPVKETIEIPKVPTRDRLDTSMIANIEMGHKDNYDHKLYPNGFDTNWLIDGDFETTWVARNYWEANNFSFTFTTPTDMDYLVWVPRLDGNFRNSNNNYTITVWNENDDLNGPGKVIVNDKPISYKAANKSYYVLKFPKQEKVKKINIRMFEIPGNTRVNASEIYFYKYNDIADRVNGLFSNTIKTEVKSDVTLEQIESLKTIVNDTEGFVYDKEHLLDLLNLAEKLVQKDNSALGVVRNGIFSINGAEDIRKFGIAINDWQPLGLVACPGDTIRIYADIPEGETVSFIATQYYEKPHAFKSEPITLTSGENLITIPKLGTVTGDRGGSLYIKYSGNKQDEIKLHIRGGVKIPYLELKDFHTLNEQQAKERISTYIDELTEYNKTLPNQNIYWKVVNSTEISLPDVLLSLPANKILEGIEQGVSTKEEKVQKLYDTILAWEDLIDTIYKTYGIDDHKNNGLQTRQNIRYMKMFSGAFMYAAGEHIGIEYNSVAPLMNGKPLSKLQEGATQNSLFGWGIAHEIGHVMDKLGKAEITNNIYSLMAQTADGKANILKSRLEINNIYEKMYEKVSIGGKGTPNDVFVQLGMYWQLHLAYDDAQNPTRFYNELYKLYRTSELNTFSGMDKFAVASSKIAQKDLTEFFTRWGVVLSETAKQEMQKFPKEERAIYYLNDESRRQRLANNPIKDINVTAKATVNENEDKDQIVTINITPDKEAKDIIGYEISRNGKTIGFTTTNTFTDKIDSANNMSFSYKVKPINILGGICKEVSAGEIRISYDNVVSKDLYTIDESTSTITFKEPTVISGIKITPKNSEAMPSGKYKVEAELVKIDGEEQAPAPVSENVDTNQLTLIKDGDFAKNDTTKENTYISYFNRTAQESDKIWTYEVNKVKLTNIDLSKYNVEFISYPGDNIEFLDLGIGKLESETFGIPAGTLVVVGKYRGNTATNEIIIKGKFAEEAGANSEEKPAVERPINGDIYMLDTPDENGKITSSTKEGIFIFCPDIQKESEIQGEHCGISSVLPTEIKAEMYKKDSHGQRMTSDTLWTSMPSYDSLPTIRFEGGQE